ncbi:tripartite tricarboxylate transporter substrate binding protein [Siccirubricoccus sp. G192]|uniref:Bug family tripartite tricarboxylate transporter substrate binding protein n=1 Tax=Siccirubricoccus sp. G192 TaxID=2849651 RepID=UPI001C2C2077|nr:tripartite tricarboxylate transporter substrate binding protein [Siccirubricoccus sp. G192]MBV1798351.1 tripartite tricarboxylate transporter substrate binding protein [Siccirubricoccus sp. G192]
MMRRKVLQLLALAAAMPARAQGQYPDRPIRLVVPYPPGGGTDILGRLVAQRLSERLASPVLVENRGGAGGNIGAQMVAQSAPDGYTLLFTGNNLAINEVLYSNPGYDSRRDFVSVARVANTPILLVVNPTVPARTLAEFIAYARQNPGRLNHGTPGSGTAQHLAGALFDDLAGTRIVHVPYRGTAPSVTGLLTGEVQAMFASASAVEALIREGKIRALAVTSARRSPFWPDLPAISEAVPGYAAELWYGVSAPARTPAAATALIEAALREALADPAFARQIEARGFAPDFLSAAGLARATEEERERWTPVLRRAGITAD